MCVITEELWKMQWVRQRTSHLGLDQRAGAQYPILYIETNKMRLQTDFRDDDVR